MNKILPSAGLAGEVLPTEFEAVATWIAEGAAARDAERQHPFEAVARLKAIRLGALSVPKRLGGPGGSLVDVLRVVLRLAEADTNVAHILRNHFTFVERYLRVPVSEKARQWLDAALGGALFGLATTELDRPKVGGGGPWNTILTPEGDGYRLRGTKYYSTGTLYADYVLTRADLSTGGQVSVVLPVDRAGLERVDDWNGIGQRVTGTGTTLFHDVRVERDEVISDEEQPTFLLPYTSTLAQLIVTAVVAGAAQAALTDAKALVKGRTRTFYYANASQADQDPILQQTIGQIASWAYGAEAAVLAAADVLDRAGAAREAGLEFGDLAHEASLAAAKAKVVVDELALRATTALFDAGGASAATTAKNLDRHWRNARTLASHNPWTVKAQLIGAHELNGTRLPDKGFF